MPTAESAGCPNVVTCTLLVDSFDALVLFYSGATYSFVATMFARKANLSMQLISQSVLVSSLGGIIASSTVCPGCSIVIDGEKFTANLMVIQLEPFDVILGMDWLHSYRAMISGSCRTVTVQTPSGETLTFQGSAPPRSLSVLARLFPGQCAVKTRLLLALAEKPSMALQIEEISVVCNYPDVFPAELPGMPPARDVEFRIDLVPGTRPISLSPYRLSRPF